MTSVRRAAYTALGMSTLSFTACFAAWVLNGVLVTFLVDSRVFAFSRVEVGWLLGIPVLTGSVLRLPVGMLADRHGGRRVFTAVMLLAALGLVALGFADSFWGFALGSLAFGLAGTSFAVGVAYTSLWFPRERQGTALGVFGAGNAGSALTSVGAPLLLQWLGPAHWRALPWGYAAALALTALAFWLTTRERRPPALARGLGEQLAVLRSVRVWRFGLYYFLVFGCFVALAQWLIPYYTNVFGVSLATAGLLAAIFSFPSGLVRALGGWLSDRFGARATMYGVLACCVGGCLLLSVPPLEMTTPGAGVSAAAPGVVTSVSATEIVVGATRYPLRREARAGEGGLLPRVAVTQTAVVAAGDRVARKQLLARGVTAVSFTPDVWLFTAVVFVVGIAMGVGKAAVYRHIPDYFPDQVGVVGGMVGVIGGLGGFVCPILFGYLLEATGVWASAWAFLALLSMACLGWMHSVVRRLERDRTRAMELALGDLPRPARPTLVGPAGPART